MKEKVIVAMSGGVDSSVAAALLQERGYAVEGMFMKNWSPDTLQSLTDCPWEQDQADAAAVCEKLRIPFRTVNFEKEYKERVVDYFLREYAAGRTPNPDVMCNKEIKFDAFFKKAQELGVDYIATGHYAQVKNGSELWRGVDEGKDQSYFLYTLPDGVLRRTIFPLGALRKREVRELALSYRLPTAAKKDSQGICFIGHIDLKKFLREELRLTPGPLLLLPPYQPAKNFPERQAAAQPVGEHGGAALFTIGERAGTAVDNGLYRKLLGGADVPPLYVLEKEGNALYLTEDHADPDFQVKKVYLEAWNGTVPDRCENLVCQARYQQKELSEVVSIELQEGRVVIEAGERPPLTAVAPGQSLVVYTREGRVVGGGTVERTERGV